VITYLLSQLPLAIASLKLMDTAAEQLSDAVPPAVVKAPRVVIPAGTSAAQVTDVADGAVIDGLASSVTVTSCSAVSVLPAASVTVHITVVLPRGKDEGALLVTLNTEQLSEVCGEPSITFVEVQPSFVVPAAVGGAEIVGFTKSKVHVTALVID
jgi:hypothetical protein